jgi:ATP-binding cassette subfamily B protein
MNRPEEHWRDKQITRYIHRMFWRTMTRRKLYFMLSAPLHVPYFILMNVFIPLSVAFGIQAIVKKDIGAAEHYAIQILIFSVVATLVTFIATWAYNRNGVRSAGQLQREVFANYLSKDYDFFANNFIGALGAQAGQIREAYVDYERMAEFELPRIVTIVGAGLTVIAYHSWALAGITLLCMVAILGFVVGMGRYRLPYRREVSMASSEVVGVGSDALSHGTTVKSFAGEAYEARHLDKAVNRWERAQLKSWDFFAPTNSIRNLLLAVTMCVLLLVSAHLYKNGSISIAIVALVQLYVIRLLSVTVDISDLIKTYEQIMARAYQPAATMLVSNNVNDPARPRRLPGKQNLALALKKVTYHYDEAAEGHVAVDDFSLTIKPGERVGLVGYSGSGKTTLTKLIMRFMDTTSGTIHLGDIDIRDVAQNELRTYISYVPQEPLLFHRSIHDNIAYAWPGASDKAVAKAAKAAYVDEFVEALPNHYQTLVGERGIKLSGGQRQRVAIARAILKDAPILVLDEATSALDSRSEKLIQEALWRLMKGRTALVIAHRLSTIQRMDRIVVMDKGRIVQIGTHEELLKQKKGVYAGLWAHQSGGYIGTPDKSQATAE